MPRLTRVQQRAQTRAAVLAAARERFLAVGYAAASLDDIAERAGFSKGAVYSNFHDKPTLCREVLAGIHDDKLGELAALARADRDFDELMEGVAEWVERTVGDVGWTMLELEFVVVSRGDPTLAEMVVELRRNAHRAVIELVRLVLGDGAGTAGPEDGGAGTAGPDAGGVGDDPEVGVIEVLEPDPALDLEAVAGLLLSAGIGLGIQRAVDPTVPVGPTVELMRGAFALLRAGTAIPSGDPAPVGQDAQA